jgi:D-threonate/D-erythronate kinase
MSGFAVIADDLTGALASATTLRQRGLRVAVLWQHDYISSNLSVDAVVVDMRTRDAKHGHQEQAKSWASSLIAAGYIRMECRMDGTLRGHTREELAGITDALNHPRPLILAVPANPPTRRITQGGVQFVHNKSSGARFSIDVTEKLFGRRADLIVDGHMIAMGGRHVANQILQARAISGATCIVADGRRDHDLAVTAQAANLLAIAGQPLITVSPGAWLAHYPHLDGSNFALVIVGSPTRENLVQQGQLEALPHVYLFRPDEVLERPPNRLVEALHSGGTVVITTLTGKSSLERHSRHAEHAARAAVAVLEQATRCQLRCSRVVVTGGHAAQHVVDALGATGLCPLDQVAPMCSRARIRGGQWDGLAVVMKGGQMGNSGTLVALAAGGRESGQTNY